MTERTVACNCGANSSVMRNNYLLVTLWSKWRYLTHNCLFGVFVESDRVNFSSVFYFEYLFLCLLHFVLTLPKLPKDPLWLTVDLVRDNIYSEFKYIISVH